MILTPLPPDRLAAAFAAFARGLDNPRAARVFRRIARRGQWRRAKGVDARRHRQAALTLARALGMGVAHGPPTSSHGWNGRALRDGTEAYVLLHEIAHFQLANPARRRRIEFGLGPGPETGERRAAALQATLDGMAREREEAMASLLGILWEAALGQPALASFLDQNWLEGAGRPGAARHFAAVLDALYAAGFVTQWGRPARRIRPRP